MADNAALDKLWGALAEFPDAPAIHSACEKVRDAGYRDWDAHTPFPVHGLDKAMGLQPSRIPWIVFVAGMVGALAGLGLQWWTSVVDYPLVIAAKPHFSWPAFIPVTFELGVLFAAAACLLGVLHYGKLPQLYHPLFRSSRFGRVTDDRFFISIESSDPQFDAEQTVDFLKTLGATHTELLEE